MIVVVFKAKLLEEKAEYPGRPGIGKEFEEVWCSSSFRFGGPETGEAVEREIYEKKSKNLYA